MGQDLGLQEMGAMLGVSGLRDTRRAATHGTDRGASAPPAPGPGRGRPGHVHGARLAPRGRGALRGLGGHQLQPQRLPGPRDHPGAGDVAHQERHGRRQPLAELPPGQRLRVEPAACPLLRDLRGAAGHGARRRPRLPGAGARGAGAGARRGRGREPQPDVPGGGGGPAGQPDGHPAPGRRDAAHPELWGRRRQCQRGHQPPADPRARGPRAERHLLLQPVPGTPGVLQLQRRARPADGLRCPQKGGAGASAADGTGQELHRDVPGGERWGHPQPDGDVVAWRRGAGHGHLPPGHLRGRALRCHRPRAGPRGKPHLPGQRAPLHPHLRPGDDGGGGAPVLCPPGPAADAAARCRARRRRLHLRRPLPCGEVRHLPPAAVAEQGQELKLRGGAPGGLPAAGRAAGSSAGRSLAVSLNLFFPVLLPSAWLRSHRT